MFVFLWINVRRSLFTDVQNDVQGEYRTLYSSSEILSQSHCQKSCPLLFSYGINEAVNLPGWLPYDDGPVT